MLTYHSIAIKYDLFCQYLYEAYVIIMFFYVLKTFFQFSFTLTSDNLNIHVEKIFILIPLLSIYKSYQNIFQWQNCGLIFCILNFIIY